MTTVLEPVNATRRRWQEAGEVAAAVRLSVRQARCLAYLWAAAKGQRNPAVSLRALAEHLKCSIAAAREEVVALSRVGFAYLMGDDHAAAN